MMEKMELMDQLSRLALDAKGMGNIVDALTECNSNYQEGLTFLAGAMYRLSDELKALMDQI